MAFIDLLVNQLFVLGIIGLLIIYTTVDTYLSYRKSRKTARKGIESAAVLFALLGIYAFVTGLYGELTWPLPGSYNILYYDVFTMLGILMIAGAWIIKSKHKMQYFGLFSLMLGVMVIFYGISGYTLGLSQAPLALLLLYLCFGTAGVLGYPVTLMIDRSEEGKKNNWVGWKVIIILFWLALFMGSVIAIATAGIALPAHLASPP